MSRRVALVTGASAGIGRAFAQAYAARGHDLLLVARRGERLRALAVALGSAHGVRVETLALDLAAPTAAATIAERLDALGMPADVLVANAGYGMPGTFRGAPWQAHADCLQVMLTGVAELTHRLLPGMRARGYGRIINVASLAGHLTGTAGHTLYIPIKAWLVRYSEALAQELAGTGVHVCALCPGFTRSEFHDVAGTRHLVARMAPGLWMSAEAVATAGIAAVERGDWVHIPGWRNRAIARLCRFLPRPLWYRLLERRAADFRRLD